MTRGLDTAIVYEANANQQLDKLELVRIDDPDAHAVQPIGVWRLSDHRQLAERLMAKICSAESKKRFEENGFEWLGDKEK